MTVTDRWINSVTHNNKHTATASGATGFDKKCWQIHRNQKQYLQYTSIVDIVRRGYNVNWVHIEPNIPIWIGLEAQTEKKKKKNTPQWSKHS